MTRRDELIRAAIDAARGPKPRRLGRIRMARLLRTIADELEQPRYHAGPGGPAGAGIRWDGRRLLIGRALWRDVGQPARVSIDISGSTTRLIPDADGACLIIPPPLHSAAHLVQACGRRTAVGAGLEAGRGTRLRDRLRGRGNTAMILSERFEQWPQLAEALTRAILDNDTPENARALATP